MKAINRNRQQLANGRGGAKKAKVQIRRAVAAALDSPVHVFDAFAGAGSLYRETWKTLAASYTGCDKRYFADDRRVFVADNRRVLRAIDLNVFNLFDLDAYGNPYEQAIIIAARRKLREGERVGFAVTEGLGLSFKNGIVPHAISELTGVQNATMAGAALYARRADMHNMIWGELAKRMHARVERFWRAQGVTGMSVAYMGIVFVGEAVAAAEIPKQEEELETVGKEVYSGLRFSG